MYKKILVFICCVVLVSENDTLTVDLHFGNELVTPLTFECDGDKVNFITPGYSLYILGSNCY